MIFSCFDWWIPSSRALDPFAGTMLNEPMSLPVGWFGDS
jgi:hypothetical protein